MIILRTIGATALRLNPNINALMYFGGNIPARPTMLELSTAIHTPNDIIIATAKLNAMSCGKRYTMVGNNRHRHAEIRKHAKMRVFKGIVF